jgi:prolyl oligopeptidase PreP (S9A serine peptidase family)
LQSNENAPNGLLYLAPLEQPTRPHWKEVVPTGPLPIDAVSAAAGRIYVNYLSNAQSLVRVYRLDGTLERELSFPMPGTIGSVRGRWESTEVFYDFSSFVLRFRSIQITSRSRNPGSTRRMGSEFQCFWSMRRESCPKEAISLSS